VKPARLGGLGAALSVIEWCTGRAVPVWMGGMFETGFARGVTTALGALPAMAWPGDLSPCRTYLADDLVPAAPSGKERPPGGGPGDRAAGGAAGYPDRLEVPLPPGPGMGPVPDPVALARYATTHQVVDGPGGSPGA
jgi:L-alanine-DL-glutamate epimerase-like enolase superfamily enzyme